MFKRSKVLPLLDPDVEKKLRVHYQLLKEWNQKFNLVSRKSIHLAWNFHYIDSLWISHFLEKQFGQKLISDIGTGAGFPGLIHAIRNESPVVLYERSQKKREFLKEATAKLELPKVEIRGDFTKGEGIFISRGVVPIDEIFPWMKKHLSPKSILVLTLGGGKEFKVPPPFRVLKEMEYVLPENSGGRKVITVSRGTGR